MIYYKCIMFLESKFVCIKKVQGKGGLTNFVGERQISIATGLYLIDCNRKNPNHVFPFQIYDDDQHFFK